jgi:HEPN domain-containing protein
MGPREEVRRRLVADWRRRADEDLAVAEHLLREGARHANAVAFHCQQAVEKYLKAFLTWREVEFPKTHDLGRLLDLVQTVNEPLAHGLRQVIALTPFGVELRYPGDRPDASPEQAHEAVRLAREVHTAVREAVACN